MTEPEYVPAAWSGPLLALLRTNTVTRSLLTPDPRALETIREKAPRSPEWIAARDAFARRYEELTAEGLEAGFLEEDYDEDARAFAVDERDYTYVSVPNPAYDPTYVPPPVVFQRAP